MSAAPMAISSISAKMEKNSATPPSCFLVRAFTVSASLPRVRRILIGLILDLRSGNHRDRGIGLGLHVHLRRFHEQSDSDGLDVGQVGGARRGIERDLTSIVEVRNEDGG